MSLLNEWLITEDEKAYLSQRSSWIHETQNVQDELFQLGPHALNYTNELKPIFLFEVKNRPHLNLFNSIMVRDGAASLLSFFYQWPSPPQGHPKLLINESLSYLVPESWESIVAYYACELDNREKQSFQGIVFTGLIHPDIICLDFLEGQLRDLSERENLKTKDAYVMTQVFSPREQDSSERTRPYYVELVALLQTFFPKLESISWNELSGQNVQEMKVLNLDQRKIICSDSYVNFNLFSRGAGSLFEESRDDKMDSFSGIALSPFHHLRLKDKRTQTKKNMSQKLYTELESLRGVIDQEFKNLRELNDRSHLLLGCPRELSSFLFYFLKQHR